MDKKAKERVAIAKDALAWAKAGALIPFKGAYVSPIDLDIFRQLNFLREQTRYTGKGEGNEQARDTVIGKCHVCALGGLMVAKAVRYDNVLVREILNDPYNKLTDHFSIEQLNTIEGIFEGWGNDIAASPEDSWTLAFPSISDRFEAIMKNIIRNKGTFVPTDLTLSE